MLSIVSQNINIVILQIWKLIAAASMDMRSGTECDKSIEDIARIVLFNKPQMNGLQICSLE